GVGFYPTPPPLPFYVPSIAAPLVCPVAAFNASSLQIVETFSKSSGNVFFILFKNELTRIYHIRTRFSWLAGMMASLMILTPLGSHAVSTVLCISEDGHIHAEKAIGLNCDRSVSDLNPDSHTAHSEGKSCTDLPLPFGNVDDSASFQKVKAQLPHVSQSVTAFFPNSSSTEIFKSNEYNVRIDKNAPKVQHKPPLVLRI
ncbi:MAG: hypothetical protein O3B41_07730, partial [Bacteroidetes bacterium]|nr:hypothetical protein [Bacteroidota bacterium]